MVPLIDIMLVLLIVFIVAAPLLTRSIGVDLPTVAGAAAARNSENIRIGIHRNGDIFWNSRKLNDNELERQLADAAKLTRQPELHLYADAKTPYEVVLKVMAAAARNGLTKIRFIGRPDPHASFASP